MPTDIDLTAPQFMRDAAEQGLKYYEEGKAGDGLRPKTVREAREMVAGRVTEDKWIRVAAWIARHMPDLDAPAADPENDDYPSAGVVAHLLWGSGPSKDSAERALAYATKIVAKLRNVDNKSSKDSTVRDKAKTVEVRVNNADFEIRETSDGMQFEGYAAVFNSASEPLPFREYIAPGAFTRSLKARNDIKLLWNHDTGAVLGSTRAGTLSLTEDNKGLRVSATLANTTTGRDVAELLRRGDVDSMSFGFSVPQNGDSWSSDGSERTLNSIRLHEVSIVAFPAYSATAGTTSVRSLEEVAMIAEVDSDVLATALNKIEDGQDITAEEAFVMKAILNELAPKEEEDDMEEEDTVEEETSGDVSMLELKKKKLELLLKEM